MSDISNSSVSANTLFHFTKSIGNLVGILKDNFKPHYCLEDFSKLGASFDERLVYAIPMVCFCDLPLFNISKHIKYYGNYGIGLSKEWGISQGVCPVLYIHQDTVLSDHLIEVLNMARYRPMIESYENPETIHRRPDYLTNYIKLYDGVLIRGSDSINIRFYDEREWRFVPKISDNLPSSVIAKTYRKDTIAKSLNDNLAASHRLIFRPGDIKYIIINDEDEILPLIHKIQDIKGHFEKEVIELLTTRIITLKQIREDYGVDD